MKLGRLKRPQVMAYPRPGLLASVLGNAFDQQGQHPDLDMDLNAMRQPMEHGRHFNLSLFEWSKALLDHQQRFVTTRRIFQCDRIIIGLDDPFPIVLGSLLNRFLINTDLIVFG